MQSFEGTTDADRSKSFLDKVASYNQSQIWTWHRVRTEKLMAVLRCIDDLPKDARMLIVGPRNEAELLLLHLYGFRLEHQRAIDIFSYSPKIELMDMHDIKFADNTFDVVYSAWTLRYSYDLKKACSELVRVAKPGGMVVTGFSHSKLNTDVTGALIEGGLSELHQMFEPHVDWVYWQESLKTTETNEEVTTIFRLRK
jgi:SAM-dependent methyltransferase